MGKLSQADEAKAKYPPVRKKTTSSLDDVRKTWAGHVEDQVLDELDQAGFSQARLNQEGLRVITTIDKKAQDAAVGAVQRDVRRPEVARPGQAAAAGAGRGGAADRQGAGLLGRPERPRHRLRAVLAAGRLGLQAVRAGDRADPDAGPGDPGRQEDQRLQDLRRLLAADFNGTRWPTPRAPSATRAR